MKLLSDVKVIDMTQFLSASYCTQILGDMGADVIKIEAPGKGEVYRSYGPKFINGESVSFLAMNRNKRSLAVNIKQQQGQDIIKKLAREADVLVENFRVGTLKKYGLDYESLQKINPALIYCSVSGFGQTGPYKDKGGFDLTAQAMSGLMAVTGEPNRQPVKVGYPIADIGGGMYAAIGVLGALHARANSGKGCHVDASLFESGVAWGMMAGLNYFADGTIQLGLGSASPQNAPYQAFSVKDGSFTMGTGNDSLWQRVCEVFEIGWLLDDPMFTTNALRVENQELLAAKIEAALSELSVEECLRRMDSVGIPCGRINTIDQVMSDEHVQDRGLILEVEHPRAGRIPNFALPLHFSGEICPAEQYPPLLGEHSRAILRDLGYSDADIDALIEAVITEETLA